MRPIRVLTWHVHVNYLLYLSQARVEFYLPVAPGRPGHGGRGQSFSFPDRVREVAGDELNYHRLEAGGFISRLKARLCSARSTILNLEIVVLLRHLLRPDVFHDHLVRHVTRARHEEATGPDMTTPTSLLQVAVFLHQQPGTLPLHPLHQIARRDMRRAGDEQVDVIRADVTLEDLDLQLRTDRPNDLAEPDADFASQ